ncbi:LACX protein [Clostridia bacterium]|nr:LACX protein [Clostridia bacterium]
MAETEFTIQNEVLTVSASAFGAELTRIMDAQGTDRLWSGDPAFWSGRAPVLFPVVGGLHEDAFTLAGKRYSLGKHGFAKLSTFALTEHSQQKMVFQLTDNAQTREAYPFAFALLVRFELSGNTLSVVYEVENRDTRVMPFQIGAHEAYACPGGISGYEIEFDEPETLSRYELTGNFLNGQTTPWLAQRKVMALADADYQRDAIVLLNAKSDAVTLRSKQDKRWVRVAFPDFETLMFWTKPGAPYICVEPWCGAPDFEDGGLPLMQRFRIQALAPGETFVRTHTITIG